MLVSYRGNKGKQGLKTWGPHGVLYSPGPAGTAGCMQSQPPCPVCKGLGGPMDQEALVKGSAGVGMGRRWAGARQLRYQLGREEKVKCSSGPARDGHRAVQGVSLWPDSSSPQFLL